MRKCSRGGVYIGYVTAARRNHQEERKAQGARHGQAAREGLTSTKESLAGVEGGAGKPACAPRNTLS